MNQFRSLEDKLYKFQQKHKFKNKGALSLALTITDKLLSANIPFDPEGLLTPEGGQVAGLSGEKTKQILARYDINRVLSKEGGRTSRGSMGNMRAYVKFINENELSSAELNFALEFWISRVREFFNSKPFIIKFDSSLGMQTILEDVLEQARERQRENPGMQYVGAVMQHLVGAKLEVMMPNVHFEHNSFTTSDDQRNRSGDFDIGDSAIHVTATVTEALIDKCNSNLSDGIQPIIVTSVKSLPTAIGLSVNKNIEKRLEFFEITQFISLNIFEAGKFSKGGNKDSTTKIISKYNDLIELNETDHSMKIKLS